MEQKSLRLQLVARPYKLDDYFIIKQMWNDHKADEPPIDVLGKSGVVVEFQGVILCDIFIFQP